MPHKHQVEVCHCNRLPRVQAPYWHGGIRAPRSEQIERVVEEVGLLRRIHLCYPSRRPAVPSLRDPGIEPEKKDPGALCLLVRLGTPSSFSTLAHQRWFRAWH